MSRCNMAAAAAVPLVRRKDFLSAMASKMATPSSFLLGSFRFYKRLGGDVIRGGGLPCAQPSGYTRSHLRRRAHKRTRPFLNLFFMLSP